MPPGSPISSDDLPVGLSPVTNRPDDDRSAITLLRVAENRPGATTHVLADIELHTDDPTSEAPFGPLPRVPGYEVLGVLGSGGMGVVYRAIDLKLKRSVALKMIASEHAGPLTAQRFHAEAQTVARLRHPNIVQIYEVGEVEDRPFLALELVEGGSLAELLKSAGMLPAPDAARLIATLAHAIHYAHAQGVVHRDLKPSNILLSREGQGKREPGDGSSTSSLVPSSPFPFPAAKIADFGLAKLLDSDQSRTRSGAILGTPMYMAPEQARGKGEQIGPVTDVYSLGAVLYECLTGRAPFEGDNSWEVLAKVVTVDALPPSHFRPRLSRDLDTICLKCLEKEPPRRYATAAALADDLDRFTAGESISARPEGLLRRVARKVRRRPLAVALVLLLGGTLALAGGFWKLRRSHAEAALAEGMSLARRGEHLLAADRLKDETNRIGRVPGCSDLHGDLTRAWFAAALRGMTEKVMFDYDSQLLPMEEQRSIVNRCRELWSERDQILRYASPRDPAWEPQIRSDLLDIALRGTEIELRLSAADEPRRTTFPTVLDRLEELRAFAGPSAALKFERDEVLGPVRAIDSPHWRSAPPPTNAAEFHRLGRAQWRSGDANSAAEQFRAGLRLNPQALALHFDSGRLAFERGELDSALASFTACLAIRPMPVAYSRRGFVLLARADRTAWWDVPARANLLELARSDFGSALEKEAAHAESFFGNAQVRHRQGRPDLARGDFENALRHGYPREQVLYPLAIAAFDSGDLAEARGRLHELLSLRPGNAKGRAMLDAIDRRSPPPNPSPPIDRPEEPKS